MVFGTKERRPFLQNADFRDEMCRMLMFQIKETGCTAVRTGGWIDHVHLVCGLSRTMTIAELLEHVKTETSKWAKTAKGGVPAFTWQGGYGAFSVSHSNLDQVVQYVSEQERHHRKKTFQDEFRELCERHQIAIDERYAWA